jgi:flagellar assembly factor FliW
MHVETERFGTLEITPEAMIEVPQGLYGFEHAKRFCLIDHHGSNSFRWLQCLDVPALAFVVINPYDFFTNYQVELEDQEATAIELRQPQDAIILNLVTLGNSPEETTANLVGPIVLNAKNRKAKQVVLANQAYTTKHRLLPENSGARPPHVAARPAPAVAVAADDLAT